MAVNDNYSCGDNSVLNQKHHQLLYFSNVTALEILEQDFRLKIKPHLSYLCAVQLVVITNSVFTNNVLPTSWYVYVRLRTLPYSVQIYDAQSETLKQNSGILSLRIM